MDLDLRLLRYAVAVAEDLHFGRAAARLMITEQTLSAQIKALEAKLGVALFVRDRRHVEVTPAGEILVGRGRRILADADDLVAELTEHPRPLVVDVLAEGVSSSVLAQHLRTQLPHAPFETRQGQGLVACLPRLVSGEVDLVFGRVPPGSFPRALQSTLVRLEPMGLALPAGHPLASKEHLRLADLAGVPLLLHSPHEAAEWQAWQEELATAFGLQMTLRVHGHGLSSAHGAVIAYGHPQLSPMSHHEWEGVVVRPLVEPVPLYPWSVVWRSGRQAARIDEVLELIQEFVAARGWLEPPAEPWWLPAGTEL